MPDIVELYYTYNTSTGSTVVGSGVTTTSGSNAPTWMYVPHTSTTTDNTQAKSLGYNLPQQSVTSIIGVPYTIGSSDTTEFPIQVTHNTSTPIVYKISVPKKLSLFLDTDPLYDSGDSDTIFYNDGWQNWTPIVDPYPYSILSYTSNSTDTNFMFWDVNASLEYITIPRATYTNNWYAGYRPNTLHIEWTDSNPTATLTVEIEVLNTGGETNVVKTQIDEPIGSFNIDLASTWALVDTFYPGQLYTPNWDIKKITFSLLNSLSATITKMAFDTPAYTDGGQSYTFSSSIQIP